MNTQIDIDQWTKFDNRVRRRLLDMSRKGQPVFITVKAVSRSGKEYTIANKRDASTLRSSLNLLRSHLDAPEYIKGVLTAQSPGSKVYETEIVKSAGQLPGFSGVIPMDSVHTMVMPGQYPPATSLGFDGMMGQGLGLGQVQNMVSEKVESIRKDMEIQSLKEKIAAMEKREKEDEQYIERLEGILEQQKAELEGKEQGSNLMGIVQDLVKAALPADSPMQGVDIVNRNQGADQGASPGQQSQPSHDQQKTALVEKIAGALLTEPVDHVIRVHNLLVNLFSDPDRLLDAVNHYVSQLTAQTINTQG